MKNQDIWKKANSLRGCLAGFKTCDSRRKTLADHDSGFLEISLFARDKASLLSSKHVRLLTERAQVFTSPHSSLIRTRMSHTLEVIACATIICDMLGLNKELAEAGALGHDIGHVPCGHQGEAWLRKAMGRQEFCHEVMGVVVAQKITRMGHGLNLNWHTLHAMASHGGKNFGHEMSPEAKVLFWADKIAFTFGDINDIGTRMSYPLGKEIMGIIESFGNTYRERLATVIASLVIESEQCKYVSFKESEVAQKFLRLCNLMHDVYLRVTEQNVENILEPVLKFLQRIQVGDPFLLLALMTDADAISLAEMPMKTIEAFNNTAVGEIAPTLRDIGKVDLCDPDLDW